jgi:long-chain acyl-CoA synthetase
MDQEVTATRSDAIATYTAPGQPLELVNMGIHGEQCRVFKNAPGTLHELYAENRSDAEFYIYEDERYTFEEVYQQSCNIAQLLVREYGVARGDRVAISLRNYPEWVMAFQAVTSIGAIAVCMNALWQTDEMEYGLSHCGARVLFADQERIDRVTPIYQNLGLKVLAIRPTKPLPQDIPLLHNALLAHKDATMPYIRHDADDDATILYTSGSTGHPKGAVSTHRNVINALLSWELDFAIVQYLLHDGNPPATPPTPENPPTALLGVPLFHVAGSHAVLLRSLRGQFRIVAMYKWDAEIAAELVEQERITVFNAPSAMTGDLLEVAQHSNRNLSSLIAVGGGGAARAPEQVKRIATSLQNAMPGTGWGMTETNAIGCGINGQNYLDRPLSSGRASAILDFAIADEDGNHLPAGERGELLVRGPTIARGYWNRPDANAETFIDRWLHTGDVAYIDEEGFVFIVDRIKELVIRGGENIGCGEVEGALLAHDDILEASVYGVPDDRLGEEICTTIFCKSELDEDALRGFLLENLAKFKVPKYIIVSPEPLPRIASGKIAKRVLREDAQEKLGLT